MSKDLTDKQRLFLDKYFELLPDSELSTYEKMRAAADFAGYSPKSDVCSILKGVSQEVVERTYEYAALHLPSALQKVIELLDNPNKLGANNLLAAANTILDRGGLAKVEKLNIKTEAPNAVLVLPAKSTINEENSNGV